MPVVTSEAKLGRLLARRKDSVQISDFETYKRVTIRMNGKGVHLRDVVEGCEVGTKLQFRIKSGQFLLSKIDARNGAFGVVPEVCDGAVITGNFWTFDINDAEIDLTYLDYFSRTTAFVDLCLRASDGTTNRRYLDERKFAALTIPLPSLDEQRRVVSKVQKAMGALDRAATLHDRTVADFDRLLMSIARDRRMFEAPKEPMALLAPLVRRAVEVDIFGRYPELGVRSFGKGTFHKPVLEGIEVGTKKLFWIKPGDLLFQIVFAWEGAVAIATDKDDGRCGSHRFLSCVCDPNKVLAEWLRLYFLSPEGLSLLGEASPGGAGRNRTLGLEKLARIHVPVPNLDDQEVIREITRKRDELTAADTFQRDADALRRAILSKAFRGQL